RCTRDVYRGHCAGHARRYSRGARGVAAREPGAVEARPRRGGHSRPGLHPSGRRESGGRGRARPSAPVSDPALGVENDPGTGRREPAQPGPGTDGRSRVSWRPTALNVSFLTLIGWALFLGVLTGRVDVIIVTVPLVVALVAGRLARISPALQIDHELSA